MPNDYDAIPDLWKPAFRETMDDAVQKIRAIDWPRGDAYEEISPRWNEPYQSQAMFDLPDGLDGYEKFQDAVVNGLRERGHACRLRDDGYIEIKNPRAGEIREWGGGQHFKDASSSRIRNDGGPSQTIAITVFLTAPFLWWLYCPILFVYATIKNPSMWLLWMFLCSLPYVVVGGMYLAMVK